MSAHLHSLIVQWQGHADGSGEENPITQLEDWLWDHAEAIADLIEAAKEVQDEWGAFGPTGTSSTLASHRRLGAALDELETE